MSFDWTEQAVELLNRFYLTEGLSAAQTARALDLALGGAPTRNAVLGKVQRMGLVKPAAEKPPPLPPRSFAKVRQRSIARAWLLPDRPLPPLREVEAASNPKPWTARLRGECCYPLGEPAAPGQQMCCAAPTGGGPYCPPHRGLMVQGGPLNAHDVEAIVAIARRAA
ncbi:MAG TPA: GcrA family cell cycle regulator [Caulobacteraceae bacterium]|nr:GcrA family cell cycle regulator [Caulobacteraceae bacterium]